MKKHNQIHTLGALHYKTHFRFLRKLEDIKCALWSEKYGKSISRNHYMSSTNGVASPKILGGRNV